MGRERGFALLAVTVVVAAVALLAWSVIAPTAWQQRAALGMQCRSAAQAAAQTALSEARTALRDEVYTCAESGGPTAQTLECSGAASCYLIECLSGYYRITVLGVGCLNHRVKRVSGWVGPGAATQLRWWQVAE